jgi:transposase
MARYKHIDTSPRFIAVDLERQLLPGSFEHALNYLIDHELDLGALDGRYRNDATGATAYPPALLLKVVLFAYSQGIVSSRGIERACREQVTFIALSGDSAPHFTTIAAFISGLGDEVARLFAQILTLCDRQGLIGGEMFAGTPALIADNGMRRRDERFKDQAKYKALPDPLYDKAHPKKGARHFRPQDFDHDPEAGTCICPAGKRLYQNGSNCIHNGSSP